jgi:TrmH family RNA methyltransferase
VAAACRALKNMGFRDLTLIEPPGGLGERSVRGRAYGAWDVLDGARVATDLREATAAASTVAATSRRKAPGTLTPRELADRLDALVAPEGRLAIVFGPEDHGLSDDQLRRCNVRVHIPTDAAQPSLNLAQAVLLVAYELRLALAPRQAVAGEPPAPPVMAGELEPLIDDLRQALLEVGYLNRENPEAVLSEIRTFLWRARPTAREVVLLRGVARQVRWAGERALGGGRRRSRAEGSERWPSKR